MNKATETTRVELDDRLVLDDLTVLRDGAAIDMTAEQQVAEPVRADAGADIDPNQFATIHRGSDASFEVAPATEDGAEFETAMAHAPVRATAAEETETEAPAPLAEDEAYATSAPAPREPVMEPEWIVTPAGEIEDLEPAPETIDDSVDIATAPADEDTPTRETQAAGNIVVAAAVPATDTEETLLAATEPVLESAAADPVITATEIAEPETTPDTSPDTEVTEPAETGTETATEAAGEDETAGEAPAEPEPEPEPEPEAEPAPEVAAGEDEPPIEEPEEPEDADTVSPVHGRHSDDWIEGSDGDDRLDGHFGDDRLFGGDGDDRLEGRHGDDTLIGGRGDDEMRGGHGDDLFIFGQDDIEGGGWHDEVDGGHGHDVIDLSGIEMGWTLHLDDRHGGRHGKPGHDDHRGGMEDEVHSGTIHFDNGAEIEFDNVESITW